MEFNKLNTVPSISDINKVALLLDGVVKCSPLEYSVSLSDRYGAQVFFKREDLQTVRSYKIRGAYFKISNIPDSLRTQGIVAASAGNHAQGVAFACANLKIKGNIFMPKSTPIQKLDAVRFFGRDYIRINLVGETYDEAFDASRKYCEAQNAIYIPPFDDFDIIAGQATVTLEIIEQMGQKLDFLMVPVGGGGLAAGASLVLKDLSPDTNLVGLEPSGAPSMSESIHARKLVHLNDMDKFVDGASVKQVGSHNFSICLDGIDQMLTIDKNHLCQAMLDLYVTNGMIVEPAGALSVAGLDLIQDQIKNKVVVCIISGGNFDPKRFPEITKIAHSVF
jgi:threonine dehydratase